MRVRSASFSDARAIAAVHVEAWRATYRGLMPDAVVDAFAGPDHDAAARALALDARAVRWRDNLVKTRPDQRTAVAEQGGEIVGFATAGPSRTCDGWGEVWAIYAAPEALGVGIGRALLGDALAFLAEQRFERVELWVLPNNARAIRFYEAAGFSFDGAERTEDGLLHRRMVSVRRGSGV